MIRRTFYALAAIVALLAGGCSCRMSISVKSQPSEPSEPDVQIDLYNVDSEYQRLKGE